MSMNVDRAEISVELIDASVCSMFIYIDRSGLASLSMDLSCGGLCSINPTLFHTTFTDPGVSSEAHMFQQMVHHAGATGQAEMLAHHAGPLEVVATLKCMEQKLTG